MSVARRAWSMGWAVIGSLRRSLGGVGALRGKHRGGGGRRRRTGRYTPVDDGARGARGSVAFPRGPCAGRGSGGRGRRGPHGASRPSLSVTATRSPSATAASIQRPSPSSSASPRPGPTDVVRPHRHLRRRHARQRPHRARRQAYGHVFDAPGTVPYHDISGGWAGTVIVEAAPLTPSPSGSLPPTPPSGTLPPDFHPNPTPAPAASPSPSATPAAGAPTPSPSAMASPGRPGPAGTWGPSLSSPCWAALAAGSSRGTDAPRLIKRTAPASRQGPSEGAAVGGTPPAGRVQVPDLTGQLVM